jgi:hypothetical protein
MSEVEMTAKEKVLAVWPDAESQYSGFNWGVCSYKAMEVLGIGSTEEAAWQNAAESLPASKEVGPVARRNCDPCLGDPAGTGFCEFHECENDCQSVEPASQAEILAELLKHAKPATEEELRAQRESYAAHYKPGPRQCVAFKPVESLPAQPNFEEQGKALLAEYAKAWPVESLPLVEAKEKEPTVKVWQACGHTMCGHNDCLDCWPMNRANFGPDDVIAVAEPKPAPSAQTHEPLAEKIIRRVVTSTISSMWTRNIEPLESDPDAEFPTEDELVIDALALALGEDIGCLDEKDDDFRERIDLLWLEDQLKPQPDSSSIPERPRSVGKLFYDGQQYIFLQTAQGPTMFAEIRGNGAGLPMNANAERLCKLWNDSSSISTEQTELVQALDELKHLAEDDDYEPDSFTWQPLWNALKDAAKGQSNGR